MSQDGASALSLKAIATQMGMTAPALYRYYSSRDELLTELILGAYAELADLVEREGAGDAGLAGIAEALRGWALTHPQKYLLLYGTPVPGYHAPDAATVLAQRIFAPILAGFAALEGGSAEAPSSPARSLRFWTRLHGVISLEVAGHFRGVEFDPAQLYRDEVALLLG
ncbi:TetR/AcrR family transcriptional regulator [Nakamurella silvestris]|nr:TetR/AcrR family transcriptional regulator [Nakamurella silvestris]